MIIKVVQMCPINRNCLWAKTLTWHTCNTVCYSYTNYLPTVGTQVSVRS